MSFHVLQQYVLFNHELSFKAALTRRSTSDSWKRHSLGINRQEREGHGECMKEIKTQMTTRHTDTTSAKGWPFLMEGTKGNAQDKVYDLQQDLSNQP